MSNIPSFGNKNKTTREYELIEDGIYEARITRFVGLGVQEQPDYQGQAKDPAFKAMFEFELIDIDTKGEEVKAAGTPQEERAPLDPSPSCQFHDVFLFPGASRGKVFELCKVLDPSLEKVPTTLDWFEDKLGSVINVNVGNYTIQRGNNAGKKRNCVRGVSQVAKKYISQVGAARRDLVFFDPYEENDKMFSNFSSLFKYQRDMLVEAIDTAHIIYAGKEPADNRPTEQKAPKADAKATEEDRPF
jgi:hypothetical protein